MGENSLAEQDESPGFQAPLAAQGDPQRNAAGFRVFLKMNLVGTGLWGSRLQGCF